MAIQSPPTLQASGDVLRISATMNDLLTTPDDGYHYELLKGVLVRMPPTQEEHGQIASLLNEALAPYCRAHGIRSQLVADIGYELQVKGGTPTVVAPDISVMRVAKAAGATYNTTAPLLAVEIVSPPQSHPFVQDKAELYLAAGTALVWVVWPDSRTVDVWTAPGAPLTRNVGETLDGGTVLPGLSIPIAAIFP